jgi:thymidylate kinase
MIVEFIGCDGAGKTTLSRLLSEQRIAEYRTVAMPDLLLDRVGLRRITQRTAVNVVQDVGGFPFFLGSIRRHRDWVAFAARMLDRHAGSTVDKLNGMRGIVRRVGMYELARSRASSRIVLSDEGTVLSAYYYALSDVAFDPSELERFARLVPRPDLIVHVKAPAATLVQRAMSRPVTRRQHAGKERSEVERTIRRTADVFDLVASTPPLRDRVIVVENDDGDRARGERLLEEISGRLQAWVAAGDDADGASFQPRPDLLRPEPRP